MKRFLILLFLTAGPMMAGGQVIVGNFGVQYVYSAPSGSCSSTAPMQIVVGSGSVYTCQNGNWGQLANGGGGFPITIGSTSIGSGSTTTTIAGLTLSGPTLSGTVTFSSITGSTQCLHVNSSGVISGTGSDCGGSGGSPGGSNTQLQFNNSGAFGGTADYTYVTHTLAGGASAILDMSAGTEKMPSSAAYGPTTAALFGYDSTNNRMVLGNGTNTSYMPWFVTAPTSGDAVTWSGTLGLLGDAGGAPALLNGSNTFSALNVFTAGINLSGASSPLEVAGSAGSSGNCFISGGASVTPSWGSCGGGTTTNALTMNNSGSGAASGTTFNGSAAETISYNTVGASPLAGSTSLTTVGTIGTGTWQGSPVAVAYGGTGTATPGLVAGTNVTITGSWPNQTINSTAAGTGTVTSVAQTFTGGLISVSGSPVTTSGTLALTVAGTSGGIPYFSSTSAWASSAALPSGDFVLGGGAGSAPTATFSIVTAAKGGTGVANTNTLTLPAFNVTLTDPGTTAGIPMQATASHGLAPSAGTFTNGDSCTWATSTGLSCNSTAGAGTMTDGSGTTTAGYFAISSTSAHAYTVDTNIDDGHTTANTLTYSGTGGIDASGGPLTSGPPSGGVGSQAFFSQEGTVPSGLTASGQDNIYADSTQHGLLSSFDGGATLPLVQGPASDTSGHVATWSGTNGGKLVDGGALPTVTGGTCTNQAVTAISGSAVPTCTTVTGAYMASNTVTSTQTAVVNTRRVCDIPVGDESASAIVNAQLGPQKRLCYIPAASTIVEMDVSADGGTPNVIVGNDAAGTVTNIVSAALATAASGGIACSNTGGTTGIDGATTCSATLQNTSLAAGSYLELVSGTAGGTAKLMTIHIIYVVN